MVREKWVAQGAPTLCFVTRSVGEVSETWMWRQIVGFTRLRHHVLTWRYVNREMFPVGDVPMHILEEPGCWPEKTPRLIRCLHRLRNLPRQNFLATTRREYASIEKVLREMRPDVMLCQYPMMALRMLPIVRRLAIPLTVHFHSIGLSSALENRWYRWSLGPALRHFDKIVVVNLKQRDWMLEHGVRSEKVHVIPCGVPVDESIPAPPGERSGAPPQFTAVSRLLKIKGIDITIRAFAGVVAKIPEARLVIVGNGPDRQEFEALAAELGLSGSVRFTGWLSEDGVRQQLRQSDVFVQHSLFAEGWPVGVAEASAMRLPVVVTDFGGLAEQVVDGVTGLIVPAQDVGRMRDSMLRLARDPDLGRRMGTAGRERMARHFNVKGQIAKLEEVLIDCAHGTGA